jgi:hypothetical protein
MTKPRVLETGEALAELLARENAALAAMDLGQAAALYPRKAAAAASFTEAQEQEADGFAAALDEEQRVLARELAERLRRLVEENRKLLERGIYVQGQVIATVARAMAQAAPGGHSPRYGASGAIAAPRRRPPMLLSARA